MVKTSFVMPQRALQTYGPVVTGGNQVGPGNQMQYAVVLMAPPGTLQNPLPTLYLALLVGVLAGAAGFASSRLPRLSLAVPKLWKF